MAYEDDQAPNQGQQSNDNPAWAPILENIPEEFHSQIKASLKEQDRQMQEQLRKYSPYKDIFESGIDPSILEGALNLTEQINENPAAVVEQMVEHFGLTDFQKKQLEDQIDRQDEFVDLSDPHLTVEDLAKDPRLAPLFEQQQEIMERFESQEQSEQEAEDQEELEAYLEELHEKFDNENPIPFDDTYVLSLLASDDDVDGEDAVEQFYNTVNQAAQALTGNSGHSQPNAPIVVGNGGGSGTPSNDIKFGSLSKRDVNDLAAQYLEQINAAENNTG